MTTKQIVSFTLVTFAVGMLCGAGIIWYRIPKDTAVLSWCKSHEKHCSWAKTRYDLLLKASDEVFFINDMEKQHGIHERGDLSSPLRCWQCPSTQIGYSGTLHGEEEYRGVRATGMYGRKIQAGQPDCFNSCRPRSKEMADRISTIGVNKSGSHEQCMIRDNKGNGYAIEVAQ